VQPQWTGAAPIFGSASLQCLHGAFRHFQRAGDDGWQKTRHPPGGQALPHAPDGLGVVGEVIAKTAIQLQINEPGSNNPATTVQFPGVHLAWVIPHFQRGNFAILQPDGPPGWFLRGGVPADIPETGAHANLPVDFSIVGMVQV